jgi:hypothetical protein
MIKSYKCILTKCAKWNSFEIYAIHCDFTGYEMTQCCPVCGKKDHLVCDEDLGDEGMFYSCHEHRGGCGSTFRIAPNGEYIDIF